MRSSEIIVCIIILTAGAGLLTPLINNARKRATINEMKFNARLIINGLYANANVADYAKYSTDKQRFMRADHEEFRTSTDYFRAMRESEFMFGFDQYGGAGVKKCRSDKVDDFTKDNNAWCVVANHGVAPNDFFPVLFTKNLNINRLGPGTQPLIEHVKPFERDGYIIGTVGSCVFYESDAIYQWPYQNLTNRILRP